MGRKQTLNIVPSQNGHFAPTLRFSKPQTTTSNKRQHVLHSTPRQLTRAATRQADSSCPPALQAAVDFSCWLVKHLSGRLSFAFPSEVTSFAAVPHHCLLAAHAAFLARGGLLRIGHVGEVREPLWPAAHRFPQARGFFVVYAAPMSRTSPL